VTSSSVLREPVNGSTPPPLPVEPPEPVVETSMTRREGLDRVETLIGRSRSTPIP
jgi:hypothetical protein